MLFDYQNTHVLVYTADERPEIVPTQSHPFLALRPQMALTNVSSSYSEDKVPKGKEPALCGTLLASFVCATFPLSLPVVVACTPCSGGCPTDADT